MSDKILQGLNGVSKDSALEFKTFREKRFLDYVNFIYSKSEIYRNLLLESDISSKNDLPKSIDEIKKLPVLDKKFLLDWGRSEESLGEVEKSVQTSGTVDNPVRIDYSKKSIEIGWGKLGIRALFLMGIDFEEKGMMLTSYDEEKKKSHSSHINALAVKEILGDSLIDQPIGRKLNESLDKIISEDVKWIGTVPMFYNASVVRAKERGIDLKGLGIKTLFYGGVGFPEEKMDVVREAYGAEILGFYPSSELCSAGCEVSSENSFFDLEKRQQILFNDYIIFEILDEDDNHVKIGERGRIVATPTFMDRTPLVRFEIGDSVVFHGHKNNFMIVSDVERMNSICFSNCKYGSHEAEDTRKYISKKTDIDITGMQIVKILGNKERDLPILRIETREKLSPEKKKILEKEAKKSFRRNEEIDILLKRGIHGGIHETIVEFYGPGKLVPNGKFKFKSISDESGIWDSYAFLQSRVQEHIGIMKELSDHAVYGLRGCKKVVDMACGSGYFSSRFAEAGMNVDGVDLSPAMIHYANKRVYDMDLDKKATFHNKAAEDTGFPANSRDGVYIANILCHISNPDDILNEAKRILKHGGKLVIGEPTKELNMESVEKLKTANKKDLDKNPWMEKWYLPFVQHNQRMIKDIKSLFSLDEMKEKLLGMGFNILDTKPTYAGNAYYILAELNKGAEFNEDILEMNCFDAPLAGRRGNFLLDFNERSSTINKEVLFAIQKFLESGEISRYSSVGSLKKKISDYAGALESEVVVTNGSYQGIDMVFRSILRKGDKVVVPKPAFQVFDHSAKMQGAEVCNVSYLQDGGFPLDDLMEAVDDEVKLIVICNPGNPVGTPILKSDIKKILKEFPKVTVLVDEAYFEFCGISCVDLISKYHNLIISRTFSKAFGLASLRVGYMISNGVNIAELSKLKSPFDVNAVAQVAAEAALKDISYMKDYVSEVMHKSKPFFEYFLMENGISYYPSSANFVFVKVDNPMEVYSRLKEKGIFVCPNVDSEFEKGVRVTIGDFEQMKAFVEKFAEVVLK